MASVTASLQRRCVFAIVVFLLEYFDRVVCFAPEIQVTCRTMLDLRISQYDAGILVSALPERIPIYANEEEKCDINVGISTGSVLMIYFDWLDFYAADMSKCDSTNIQLYDGSAGVYVQGLQRQICGREEQMPTGVYFIEKYHLLIRVSALGVIHGSGFRIHFTLSRRAFPCAHNELACETFGSKRCIAEHLVCDDWNDCGDWVDEQQDCNNITAGGIAAIVISAVGLIALIVGLIIFCKCRRDREIKAYSEKDPAIIRDTSAASTVSGGLMAPYSISSEQLEKDRYMPRYTNARSSRRSVNKEFKSDYEEERPPPYTENGPPGINDSRSDDPFDDDPRSRRNRKGRDDEVYEEDERRSRRGRRSRTSSVDREEKQTSNDDRYPRDPEDRYPSRRGPDDSRDDRYPSRRGPEDRDIDRLPRNPRDDRDYPPPSIDDRYPSRRNDDRDSDSKYSRESERDRRRDDRVRDRDQRRSHHAEPDDRSGSDLEGLPVDQLHPLRVIEKSRRSLHSDSDQDSRSDRDLPRRSRTPPPQMDRDPRDDRGRNPPRDRDDRGRAPRDRDDDDDFRAPPSSRDDRPASRDDRPASRDDRPTSRRERPVSRNEGEDAPPKSRPFRSGSPPPPPPLDEEEEDEDDETQRRRRRSRRSRSREDRQRSRYGDAGKNGGDPSRESVAGVREEAV